MRAFLTFTIILCYAIITQAQDLKMINEIASLLAENTNLTKLHYPQSVIRFYAKNAALYALHLANALKCNIDLCHAFTLPVDSPMLGQTA